MNTKILGLSWAPARKLSHKLVKSYVCGFLESKKQDERNTLVSPTKALQYKGCKS